MAAELPVLVPVPVPVAGPGPAARGAAGGAAGPPGAAGAGDPSAAGPSAAPPAPARQGAPSVFKHGTSKMWFFKAKSSNKKKPLYQQNHRQSAKLASLFKSKLHSLIHFKLQDVLMVLWLRA